VKCLPAQLRLASYASRATNICAGHLLSNVMHLAGTNVLGCIPALRTCCSRRRWGLPKTARFARRIAPVAAQYSTRSSISPDFLACSSTRLLRELGLHPSHCFPHPTPGLSMAAVVAELAPAERLLNAMPSA